MPKNIKKVLMGFEYETLSLLLHFWAEQCSGPKRSRKWSLKIKKLREAIISGTEKGKHELHIPSELVLLEYRNTLDAIEQIQNEIKSSKELERQGVGILKVVKINTSDKYKGEKIVITRPIPIPSKVAVEKIKEILLHKGRKKKIVREIVGLRLGCKESKVLKNIRASRSQRNWPYTFQANLIGIFLDLCSIGPLKKDMPLLAKILKVLFVTKCHLLMMEYMLQNAPIKKNKFFYGNYETNELEDVCDTILDIDNNSNIFGFNLYKRLVH